MARPSKIDPALAGRIAASSASPARLLAELQAEGVSISGRTLRRHLAKAGRAPVWAGLEPKRRARAAPAHMAPVRELESEAVEALAGTDVERLSRSRNAVWRAMVQIEPELREPRQARAYIGLARQLGDLAVRLAELNPPPPINPENDPANVAAKVRLLGMVDAVLARGA
jgi:hypothetical protein